MNRDIIIDYLASKYRDSFGMKLFLCNILCACGKGNKVDTEALVRFRNLHEIGVKNALQN